MDNKSGQPIPTHAKRKPRLGIFWLATLATAIPLVILVAIAIFTSSGIVGGVGGGVAVVAFVAAIILIILGKRSVGAGILAGIGFGTLALVISCFAAVFTTGI